MSFVLIVNISKFGDFKMSFLTVSYLCWHILGNKDMCEQFLRKRDLYASKNSKTYTEAQNIKAFWRHVKNKYSIKSRKYTNLFKQQLQEDW